jgi:hypothetical protein
MPVEVVVDGVVLGSTLANYYRAGDLATAGYGHGRHGIEFRFPVPLASDRLHCSLPGAQPIAPARRRAATVAERRSPSPRCSLRSAHRARRNDGYGAGRAIPGAKTEWPRRVHSGRSAAGWREICSLSASEGKRPLGGRTRRARLMTTRRGQAPPSPLQISAPFCPLLCSAIDRSQPLPGRTRSSPLQHCNGATPRSLSLKQQHNFRHRFANPIRAGRPTLPGSPCTI